MRNYLGISRLQAKVEQLRQWLGGRQETIRLLLERRRQELADHDRAIQEAERQAVEHMRAIDGLRWKAERELMEAEARERSASECRRRAADLTRMAQEHPTGVLELGQATEARRTCWSGWRARMRTETQGEVRRKYHELGRLTKRLARRQSEPEPEGQLSAEDIQYGRLPEGYGTPRILKACSSCCQRPCPGEAELKPGDECERYLAVPAEEAS